MREVALGIITIGLILSLTAGINLSLNSIGKERKIFGILSILSFLSLVSIFILI